jgi:hypothetical protein
MLSGRSFSFESSHRNVCADCVVRAVTGIGMGGRGRGCWLYKNEISLPISNSPPALTELFVRVSGEGQQRRVVDHPPPFSLSPTRPARPARPARPSRRDSRGYRPERRVVAHDHSSGGGAKSVVATLLTPAALLLRSHRRASHLERQTPLHLLSAATFAAAAGHCDELEAQQPPQLHPGRAKAGGGLQRRRQQKVRLRRVAHVVAVQDDPFESKI